MMEKITVQPSHYDHLEQMPVSEALGQDWTEYAVVEVLFRKGPLPERKQAFGLVEGVIKENCSC